MREDLLHFIWKFRKLKTRGLTTSSNESIVILDSGTHNFFTGPDFFNAQVKIGGQKWAGNVEMHVKASDWYAHHHERDDNYKNIILHVVWENDIPVYCQNNRQIPTLELRKFISKKLLSNYHDLLDKKTINFVNCEKDINSIDKFVLDHWLERLYFERLERKSQGIMELLKSTANDWENVLFLVLLKNFGLKINGQAFLTLGRALDFSIVQKTRNNTRQLESLLMGMAGLLDATELSDTYFMQLKEEYHYLKKKFRLEVSSVVKPEFFKLRPTNFPTLRLSQFASLYKNQRLFSKVLTATNRREFMDLFQVSANTYWDSHYNFGRRSAVRPKTISSKFVDLLLINAILPLKFCHARHIGNTVDEDLIALISELKPEINGIIHNFKDLGLTASSAMESQAILQLYNEYCTRNKCLQCAVGTRLLNGK